MAHTSLATPTLLECFPIPPSAGDLPKKWILNRTMWKSQDDIVKDLACLNDFGDPEDKEPYKALYSIGRGSKFKEKNKSSEKFVDSRTGEVIDADELLDSDYSYKGKGRGSLLGGFSRSKFQLQQQLRLARPLGSGDEAVESYYGRNHPIENLRNSESVLDSEINSKNGETTPENLNSNLNLDRMKHRIKAVRNSSTDSNALINGLLTKLNKSSEIQIDGKERKFVRNEENLDEIPNSTNVSINCSDSGEVFENGCNEFRIEGSSLKNMSDVDVTDCEPKGECSGKTAFLKDTLDSSSKTLKSSNEQDSGIETFNYLIEEEKEEPNEEVNEIKGSLNYWENNFYDSTETQQDRNEKYRLLGEKLNRLRKTDPKASESGMYDFREISRCIAPVDNFSDTNSMKTIASNTVPASFTVKEEDFPPLL